MIGALAGFALVFVVTLVTTSSIAGLVLARSTNGLQRRGPLAERRAAEAAAIVPPVLAGVAVGVLMLQSVIGIDHCTVHGHHAHLCFAHGGEWIERAWVVVVLAVAGVTFAARAAIAAVTYLRGAASIRALRAASEPCGDVRIVASERAFCFVARGGVYVSSRVWSKLADGERAALVAHDRAHERNGDLAKRLVLEIALVFSAPLVGDVMRATWLRASERLCDAHAADVTDPETVARAMVAMCRLGTARPAASFAFTPVARELAGRIEAVLEGGPLGERAARGLVRVTISCCVMLALAGIAAAEPLHHAFETLLG